MILLLVGFGAAAPVVAQTAGTIHVRDARPVPPPLLDRALFFGNAQISGARISPDGRYVIFRKPLNGVEVSGGADAGTGVPAARDLTPVDGIRARIYAMPGATPNQILIGLNDRDPAWHDVYRLDLETGERTLLIENNERVAAWRARPRRQRPPRHADAPGRHDRDPADR